WEKKRGANRQFSFPDNLVRSEIIPGMMETESDIEDNDRRRLVYVGMTRAKKDLILSYAKQRDDSKLLTPSRYLTEIGQDVDCFMTKDIPINEEYMAEYLAARMSGQYNADLFLDDTEVKKRIENYVLNVSALNQYLECPLK